ncbi:MAG: AAA family ATPase [Candidatus Hydrogenedentes bacterium]|nr:AAA family ATPase [Candidatus Hydrogenedentota bacterium]
MYESFYGLEEKPFNLTPDPKYLFLSDNHKEAFAHLLFGIKNRSGFVMVTGEIGTGKTTICRTLLNQLDDETEVAFIFNTSLSPLELIRKINTEFGIKSAGNDVQDLIDELNEYLLEATRSGKKCVLVVDEAQNLSPAVLEQVRLLSNLETETEKLLQIVLIGQPELAEKLQLHELRQLNQRITARYHLHPLTQKETQQYIAYRLHTAGARRKNYFTKGALSLVFHASGGTPRVINAICDRSLLIGYTKESPVVARNHIRQAVKEIKGEKISTRAWSWSMLRDWLPSPPLLVTAVLVILVVMVLQGIQREWSRTNTILGSNTTPQAVTPTQEVATAAARPAAPEPTFEVTASAPAPEPVAVPIEEVPVIASRILEHVRPSAPVAPASAPEVPAPPALGTVLASVSPEAARNGAAQTVLAAWGMAAPTAPPAGDTPEALAAFARQQGFAQELLQPALDQLLAIGLPAFVEMNTSSGSLWLALLGLEGRDLRLSGAPGEQLLAPRDQFLEYYAGRAVVLWRDAAPQTPILRQGRSGPVVSTLKEQLRRLERLPVSNTSQHYDSETAAAVAKLQAETGLYIDGVTGRQVRMVLSSWSPAAVTPSLLPRVTMATPPPEPGPPASPPTPAPPSAAPAPTTASVPASVPEQAAPAPVVEPARPDVGGRSFGQLLSGNADDAPETGDAAAPETAPEVSAPQTPKQEEPPAPAAKGPQAAATTPAPEETPTPKQIVTQELPAPATTALPPVDLEARKESTTPAPPNVPLVPHDPDA